MYVGGADVSVGVNKRLNCPFHLSVSGEKHHSNFHYTVVPPEPSGFQINYSESSQVFPQFGLTSQSGLPVASNLVNASESMIGTPNDKALLILEAPALSPVTKKFVLDVTDDVGFPPANLMAS